MKLTTTTHVSVDGVMQGLGGADEDRRGGFERGGWAIPLFDDEAEAYLVEVFQRADALLLGRRDLRDLRRLLGNRLLGGERGRQPDLGTALDLVDSRSTPGGVTIQVYRPTRRPQYAT